MVHLRMLALAALVVSFSLSCTVKKDPLGTEKNPVKFFLVPSVDANLLMERAKGLEKILEKDTGYEIKISVPASYIAVVEAFGTKRADVAVMNTFGYLIANQKYGTEAKLLVIRHGEKEYRSQIIARKDSTINSLKDIDKKKFAFVDPASTSGYLLPSHLFKKNNIKLSETTFAQKHDNVVTMVYQKQVDAGATFYSPPLDNGEIQDARRLVKTQFPDVEDQIKIVTLTESIPNDPIMFRKDMPEEMKTKIIDSLMAYVKTKEGKEVFESLYLVNGLVKVKDDHYDGVRKMLDSLELSPDKLIKN